MFFSYLIEQKDDCAEPDKHREKKDQADTSNSYNFQNHTFRAVKVEHLISNLYFSKIIPAIRLLSGYGEFNFGLI